MSGISVHWPASVTILDIFVNPQNSQNDQNLSEAMVQSIATSSILEWNGLSRIKLRKSSTSGKDQNDLNELYFSSDPSVFNGSAVIGITLVSFNETNGEISSADILINDNYSFATDSTELNYLGNVITHEVGHFLGLGHGQVAASTMFYALTRGQNKVADDDRAGLYSIYPTGDSTKGIISGTIVGGKNLALVFGVHVQAISVKTGKVMGAAVSELNGKFRINGLPKNDQYIIYTSPIKQMGLPSNYTNARSDFCEASSKYRGSFFQSCGSRSEGFPQAVKLDSSLEDTVVDVGKITIRCGLDTPPEYIQNKNTSPSGFDINTYTSSGLGGSFVGFFSASEMQLLSVQDFFKINFSNIENWDAISQSSDLYVELKVINQSFYSAFKVNVNVKRGLANYDVTPKYVQSVDGRVSIDTLTRIPISRSVPSDNDFEIKILPEVIDLNQFPAGIPFSKSDLFPSYSDMEEDLYFYLVTATIVKDNGDGTFTQVASKNDLLSDNTTCPDAINTYALTNFSAKGTSFNSDRKKALGCGTVVDINNGTGGGPGGFMIGLLMAFIISYALSRYSKMA